MSDVFGFKSLKCPVCGVPFVPAPMHAYKDSDRLYCTYACFCKRKKKTSSYKKVGYANPRPVIAYTLDGKRVGTFPTMAAAARELDVNVTGVKAVCDGKNTHAGGYKFKYKNKSMKSQFKR